MPNYESVYEHHRLRVLADLIPRGQGLALDVGCNDGSITQVLDAHGFDAVGVDTDAAMVSAAKRSHPHLRFLEGSAETAEALGRRKLTLCLEVIEHLDARQQHALLESIARSTAQGGHLVLSTPGRYSLYSLYERGRRGWRDRGTYD
ncbi:MAG: class I SAM-dependent methyltransferase, partial [Actinomycetota bacterium]|nr:class I SAM-dependent methyltransferase [Actinomycetota bacterium]